MTGDGIKPNIEEKPGNGLSDESLPEARAVIDIGSNSIKLRVIRREGDALHVLIDRTELVRMGRGLGDGMIAETTMQYGIEVIQRMARTAGEMEAELRVVGTIALRSACNAGDFIRQVRERTGMTVEVLSEEQEAYLAWLGAVHSLGVTKGDIAVLDIGGGSTQFVVSADSRIVHYESIPIGTVN